MNSKKIHKVKKIWRGKVEMLKSELMDGSTPSQTREKIIVQFQSMMFDHRSNSLKPLRGERPDGEVVRGTQQTQK